MSIVSAFGMETKIFLFKKSVCKELIGIFVISGAVAVAVEGAKRFNFNMNLSLD